MTETNSDSPDHLGDDFFRAGGHFSLFSSGRSARKRGETAFGGAAERGRVKQPVSSRRGGPQNPCFIPARDISRHKKNADEDTMRGALERSRRRRMMTQVSGCLADTSICDVTHACRRSPCKPTFVSATALCGTHVPFCRRFDCRRSDCASIQCFTLRMHP